jgi:hypothetical protein
MQSMHTGGRHELSYVQPLHLPVLVTCNWGHAI